MLSLKQCRALVGNDCQLSDNELQRRMEQLYGLARVLVENLTAYPSHEKHSGDQTKPGVAAISASHSDGSSPADYSAVLALLSDDERYEIEERAAIHEFEGGCSKDKAQEFALQEFWQRKLSGDQNNH